MIGVDMQDRTCPACQTPLPEDADTRRIFCNNKCKSYMNTLNARAAKAATKLVCVWCGDALPADSHGRRKYCSRNCKDASLWRKNHPVNTGNCEACGKSLVGKKSHARFCNRSCKSIASNRRRYEREPDLDRRRYDRERAQRMEYATRYARANPHIGQAAKRARRAAIFDNPESRAVSGREWKRLVDRFDGCCAYCGKSPSNSLHMDHVIPLTKGGRHAIGNLLPACERCNTSKSNSLLSVWRYKGRGVDVLAS